MTKKNINTFFTIFGISLFLGTITLVCAIGFHSANEILGGNFTGNFSFNNNIEFNGDVNFTKARIHGLNGNNNENGKDSFVEFTEIGTYSFTVPENVSLIHVTLIGAGGGGGGGHRCSWHNYYAHGGFGGLGGFADEIPIYVNPGEKYTIIIGNPGIGGNGRVTSGCATAYAGTDGEPTQFKKGGTIIVSASGGTGGKGGRANGGVSCNSNINGANGIAGTPTMYFYNQKYGNKGNRGIATSSGSATLYNGGNGESGYAKITWNS